jgi:hypothetical protein
MLNFNVARRRLSIFIPSERAFSRNEEGGGYDEDRSAKVRAAAAAKL